MKPHKHDATSTPNDDRMSSTPLNGTTVLVTRPINQSTDLARQLEEFGATVIHCPTIEIGSPENWEGVDRAIGDIVSYDWLVFMSANGARFFFDRSEKLQRKTFHTPATLLICAIGPATAKVIESAGGSVDLTVDDSRAEGVLRGILDRAGGESAVRGLRFLLPCARHARDFLPVELRKLSAQVDVVEAYQTLKPNVDLGSLFTRHEIDAITFTSPSTVSNFAKLAGDKLLAALADDTLAACIGPVTAAAATDHGFKRIVQAQSANAQALAESIVRSLGNL